MLADAICPLFVVSSPPLDDPLPAACSLVFFQRCLSDPNVSSQVTLSPVVWLKITNTPLRAASVQTVMSHNSTIPTLLWRPSAAAAPERHQTSNEIRFSTRDALMLMSLKSGDSWFTSQTVIFKFLLQTKSEITGIQSIEGVQYVMWENFWFRND